MKIVAYKRPAHYDFDVGCYLVSSNTDIVCCDLSCFIDYHPLSAYVLRDNTFAVLRHQLVTVE